MDKPTTEQMIMWLTHQVGYEETREAIRARLTEYDALKELRRKWESNAREWEGLYKSAKARAEKAEAEVERLKETISEWQAWADRACKTITDRGKAIDKAEAELALAKPLLEAVMKCDTMAVWGPYRLALDDLKEPTVLGDVQPILRAALAYRAAKSLKDEEK